MLKVALKGLAGRKLRAALTAFAVVLGVAMISGTFVLTDTIKASFSAVFTTVYKQTDIVISGRSALGTNNNNGQNTPPSFPASLLARVRAVPGVDAAVGGVAEATDAHLVGRNGKDITFGFAPNLGFSVNSTGTQRFNPLTLTAGRFPVGPHEIAIDAHTASAKHYAVGQKIGASIRGPVQQFTITGLVKLGGVASLGGATMAIFDLPTAQKLFGKVGELDEIYAAVKHGESAPAVIKRIRAVLPPTTIVRSGEQQAAKQTQDTSDFTSILQKFLLAFGGIALFVGIFVIANTLSITIAQRAREFGTLRTLGATRKQIRRSVILEGALIGLAASVAGLFLGLGLAKGLESLLGAFRHRLPAERDGVRGEDRDCLDHRRHARDRARKPLPCAAGDSRRADRSRAGRRSAAVASRAFWSARRTRHARSGARAAALRDARQRRLGRSAPPRRRAGRDPLVHRHGACRAAVRPAGWPASSGLRAHDSPARRDRWRARTRCETRRAPRRRRRR